MAIIIDYAKNNIYTHIYIIKLHMFVTLDTNSYLILISDISVGEISTVCSHFIIQKNAIIQLEAHLTETP